MALREYTDPSGTTWRVWNVEPMSRETPGYTGEERRALTVRGFHPDRRRPSAREASLMPEMRHGWLCFEAQREKRRLAPIPAGWEECPDEAIGLYLMQAELVRVRPRRAMQ